MSKQFIVYWAHLPSHTDMFSEGYIGITSKTIDKRIWQHLNAAKNGKNTRFCDAIRKYGGDIKFDIILVCDKKYAEYIESKLRPFEWVGWNIAVGGFSGNADLRVKNLVSDETRKLLSKSARRNAHIHAENAVRVHTGRKRSKETKEKISEALKGKTFSDERKVILSKAQTGKLKWLCSRANKQLWSIADFIYNVWASNGYCGVHNLSKSLSISIHSLINIHKYFKDGWNPLEDIEWQKFKHSYLKDN